MAQLRGDLSHTKRSLVIVGPWLDAYFADMVTGETPAALVVRVLTRPQETAGANGWSANISCIERMRDHFARCTVRSLPGLHAKCIVIDDVIAFVGSANWYRHSLEHAREIVVRARVEAFDGLVDEIETLWDAGTVLESPRVGDDSSVRHTTVGRVELTNDVEEIDPIARKVLETVPKAFILRTGKPPTRGR